MFSQYLIIFGAAIFLLLGTLHLYYTFFSNKFLARNAEAVKAMQQTSPIISKGTTMWKAWIGFNGSHSLGAIFFGAMNIILAWSYFNVVQHSFSIRILDLAICFFYLFLAKKYWFKIPFAGILIATTCFAASATLNCF